jgi:TIR domain-containing protein
MAHDAFISHSHQDKAVADAACTILENSGIRCWIAPRDVPPGSQWAGAIVHAIDQCRVIVLIFSSQANISNQIHREVEHAVGKSIPIYPLRIEDVVPSDSMEYFLGSIHWLDALTPPLESHLYRLADAIKSYLDVPHDGGDAQSRSAALQRPPIGSVTGSKISAAPARHWLLPAVICLLIAAAAGAAFFYFGRRQPVTPATVVASVPAPANPTAVLPSAAQPPARPVPQGRQITFNEAAVRAQAAKQGTPLPPSLTVIAPSAKVSADFAAFVGAWGSEVGGLGRTAILIVEDVEQDGQATGVLAMGSPNASTLGQGPAFFSIFTGVITDEGLNFTLGASNYTFKHLQDDRIWGHIRGDVGSRHFENTIIFKPIE